MSAPDDLLALTSQWLARAGSPHPADPATAHGIDDAAVSALLALFPQYLWEADAQGRVTWTSESGLRYTGLKQGQTQDTAWLDTVAPHMRRHILSVWQSALDAGTPYEVEMPIRRHDGEHRWHLVRANPVRDAAGQVVRWVGNAIEIHDAWVARERLHESERQARLAAEALAEARRIGDENAERYRLAVLATDAGAYDWDLLRDELNWDARTRALFGLAPGEVPSYARFLDALHPDDAARMQDRVSVAFADPAFDGNWRERYRVRDGAGGWRWIESPGHVHFQGEGAARRPARFVGLVFDITERIESTRRLQESEQALREADRRKNEFLATLAHELRNPLAPVMSAVAVMRREARMSAPAARALDMLDRQARHMSALLDDLLDVDRVSRGTITLRLQDQPLDALVRAALESVQPRCEARGQRLDARWPAHPVRARVDAVRFAQILENLLVNASKYTPDGGRIVLSMDTLEQVVEIRVEDDGVGLPADQLDAIFGLFVQVEPGVGTRQGGLGIGLSLVRQLVTLHGGTVHAESAGPGRGACFVVRLPRDAP